MKRVNHLVFIAGAQASGKSTFIQHWRTGRIENAVREALPTADKWLVVSTKGVRKLLDANTKSKRRWVVVQYDTMRRLQLPDFDRDEALQFVSFAKKVTIVALSLPTQELHRRLINRHAMRADGRFKRVPPGRFDLRLNLLDKLARRSAAQESNGLVTRVIEAPLRRVAAAMRPWPALVLRTYARDPEAPSIFLESFVDAVAKRATRAVTVVPVKPTPYRRRNEIGWVVAEDGVRRIKPRGRPEPTVTPTKGKVEV